MSAIRNTCFSIKRIPVLASALLLAACGGGGGGGSSGTTSFSLAVTDAPVDDATNVSVAFTGVDIQRSSGQWMTFDFDTPKTINLLALQGGGREFLFDGGIPADCYQEIRARISSDAQAHHLEEKTGGTRYMHLDPGYQEGLQVHHEFCITQGVPMDLTIHFDLRKSLHCPDGGGDCTLRPVLHLIDDATACRISGAVDPSHISAHNASCAGGDVVYVFEGHDVTPCDVCEGDQCAGASSCSASPITTAMVNLDPRTGDYVYTAAYLGAGNYTVAFTCDAQDDQPDTHESLQFVGHSNESCSAGEDRHHHFRP